MFFFFFQAEDGIRDHCVTGVQTCALPIFPVCPFAPRTIKPFVAELPLSRVSGPLAKVLAVLSCGTTDRKSTRLNSSHTVISYAVFCLKKKKEKQGKTK